MTLQIDLRRSSSWIIPELGQDVAAELQRHLESSRWGGAGLEVATISAFISQLSRRQNFSVEICGIQTVLSDDPKAEMLLPSSS